MKRHHLLTENHRFERISTNIETTFLNMSLAEFAQSIKENDYLFKDTVVSRELGQLAGTMECYVKEKAAIIKCFFEILKKSKILGYLTQAI